MGSPWEVNDVFSKRLKFNVLRIKSTYLVSILYSLLFGRVSGRFEAFSASWRLLVVCH